MMQRIGQTTLGLTAIALVSGLWGCGVPTTPTAIAAPTESQVVADLVKNHQRFRLCSESLQADTAQKFSQAYKVDNQTYFVVLQCFLGAYQGNHEFVLYSPSAQGTTVKSLKLTTFEQAEDGSVKRREVSSVGGLPTFDPKQRTLTILTKYRGVGDCGTQARYRLDGKELKLLTFKAKFDCDGKLEPYQQLFPVR